MMPCGRQLRFMNLGCGDGTFLRPLVGVEDFDSDVLGIVKAGTSTGLGFCAFQSVQNVTFAQGSAWIDP